MTPVQKFRLKLAGLGLLAAVLVYQLTRPIPTHAEAIDPLSSADIAKVDQAAKAFERLQMIAMIELVALACVIWLAWRIYRTRPKG